MTSSWSFLYDTMSEQNNEDVTISSNISDATSADWNDFWGAADTVSMFEGGEDVISFDVPDLPEAPKNDN